MKNNDKLYNENIETVTDYLISLYYKTGCKYWCQRPQMNRLLTIYKLCTMKYNPDCFEYQFKITDDSIGFYGYVLTNLMHFDVYNAYPYIEPDGKYIEDELDETVNIPKLVPKLFTDIEITEISEPTKKLIEKIFRKFGNYEVAELAKNIDELIGKLVATNQYWGSHLKQHFHADFLWDEECCKLFKDNEIFNFIKNFENIKLEKNNTNKVKVKK